MLKGMGLLNSDQQKWLSFFAQLPDSKIFFLTGGTALSEFFLGHRYSYDLDFFTGQDNLIQSFSDETESWPVKMIQPFQAVVLKQFYKNLSVKLMKDISP